MTQNFAKRALDFYGIEAIYISPPKNGYRNQSFAVEISKGKFVNLIVYKAEKHILAKIHTANTVSSYLKYSGLPIRLPINDKILKISSASGTRFAGLYNYLPGDTIPWEGYTMKHLKLLGQNLALLHESLKPMPPPSYMPSVAEYSTKLNDQMKLYFEKSGVMNAIEAKLQLKLNMHVFAKHTKLLQLMEETNDRQPLHMDFVRGNILFSDSPQLKISGIIDFEKAAYGYPVFDVARTLAFLLVDCKYKSELEIRKYFLRSGYNKMGKKLRYPEAVLEELLNFYLIYDFYKFLLHNPYENLVQNEHFIRTKDIMLNRALCNNVRINALDKKGSI